MRRTSFAKRRPSPPIAVIGVLARFDSQSMQALPTLADGSFLEKKARSEPAKRPDFD
jgi:hypothetical protein